MQDARVIRSFETKLKLVLNKKSKEAPQMKFLIVTLLISFATISTYSQTQLEMNTIAAKSKQSAYDLLDSLYNKILERRKTDTVFIEKFKISQDLWLKFREAQVDMNFPPRERRYYGSMQSMCKSGYMEKLTKERIKTLKKFFQPIPKGEGCAGTMGSGEYEDNSIYVDQIDDYESENLFNNIQIFKEFETDSVSVRIFTIPVYTGISDKEDGEYAYDLYFAVAENKEYPEQKLYKVDRCFNPKIEAIDTSDAKKPIIKINVGRRGEKEILTVIPSLSGISVSKLRS